jgi:hypothetical protein
MRLSGHANEPKRRAAAARPPAKHSCGACRRGPPSPRAHRAPRGTLDAHCGVELLDRLVGLPAGGLASACVPSIRREVVAASHAAIRTVPRSGFKHAFGLSCCGPRCLVGSGSSAACCLLDGDEGGELPAGELASTARRELLDRCRMSSGSNQHLSPREGMGWLLAVCVVFFGYCGYAMHREGCGADEPAVATIADGVPPVPAPPAAEAVGPTSAAPVGEHPSETRRPNCGDWGAGRAGGGRGEPQLVGRRGYFRAQCAARRCTGRARWRAARRARRPTGADALMPRCAPQTTRRARPRDSYPTGATSLASTLPNAGEIVVR